MAENEFPVAAQGSGNVQNLPADPATNTEATENGQVNGNQNTIQDSNEQDFTAPLPDDSRSSANYVEEKPKSKFQEFLHSGDVFRKLLISGLLVLFLAGAILGIISLQSPSNTVNYRTLGQYTAQEIGPVLDFLQLEGYDYQLQPNNTIVVPVDQYTVISETMLRRGIAVPKATADNANQIIMQDSSFGVSQRLEGERIKYGREQQLARAIERIDGIEHATVLLAIPKDNVFARDKARPTAAVVVTLKQGAFLSPENVSSIRFMVASSVQNLLSKDVTVTDQNGRLLSAQNVTNGNSVDEVLRREFELRTLREAQYRDKLDSILGPMLGYGNYTSEVDVTLDTTRETETRQLYNPNNQAVISETLREQRGQEEQTNPYGVPGSLSNQPPANAAIPQQLKDGTQSASSSTQGKESREAIRNYEVDTTIRSTTRPTNVVTKITVSVAVDYMKQVGADGSVTFVPRPEADLQKIADLVRGGLGLDPNRGDFVNVASVQFPHPEAAPPLPWYQQEYFFKILRILGAVVVILVIVLVVIRPMVNRLLRGKTEEDHALDLADLDAQSALDGNDDLNILAARNDKQDQIYSINREGGIELPDLHKDEDLLKAVRTLVSNEPELSSEVIREWVDSDNKDDAKEKEKEKQAINSQEKSNKK